VKQRGVILATTLLAALCLQGCCSPSTQLNQRSGTQAGSDRNANLIAHIEHKGLSFSISINPQDDSFLKIVIPERFSPSVATSRPSVRLSVLMRDDSVIEGVAKENPPWVGGGGWVDVGYLFAMGRKVSVDEIHSVTIWIGDERYVAFPF
jgi:hypothetical protein